MPNETPGPQYHGHPAGYGQYRCRCPMCRATERDRWRARPWPRQAPRGGIRHGTPWGRMNYGCMCEDCGRAARTYHAARRVARRRNRQAARR